MANGQVSLRSELEDRDSESLKSVLRLLESKPDTKRLKINASGQGPTVQFVSSGRGGSGLTVGEAKEAVRMELKDRVEGRRQNLAGIEDPPTEAPISETSNMEPGERMQLPQRDPRTTSTLTTEGALPGERMALPVGIRGDIPLTAGVGAAAPRVQSRPQGAPSVPQSDRAPGQDFGSAGGQPTLTLGAPTTPMQGAPTTSGQPQASGQPQQSPQARPQTQGPSTMSMLNTALRGAGSGLLQLDPGKATTGQTLLAAGLGASQARRSQQIAQQIAKQTGIPPQLVRRSIESDPSGTLSAVAEQAQAARDSATRQRLLTPLIAGIQDRAQMTGGGVQQGKVAQRANRLQQIEIAATAAGQKDVASLARRMRKSLEDQLPEGDDLFSQVSFEMFGRQPNTPEETRRVRERVAQIEARQAGSEKRAELAAERNQPISPRAADVLGLDVSRAPTPGELRRNGQFVPTDKQLDELQELKTSVRTASSTAQNVIQDLDQESFGAPGILARSVSSIADQASAIGSLLNVKAAPEVTDPSTYNDTFRDLQLAGDQNARLRSAITSLAFQAAAASGQEGRSVSDRDVRRFIEEIGGSTGSARQFRFTLRSFVERLNRNFRERVKVLTGGIDPGQGALPGGIDDPISEMNQQELDTFFRTMAPSVASKSAGQITEQDAQESLLSSEELNRIIERQSKLSEK